MLRNIVHINEVLGNTLNTRDEASKLMRHIQLEYAAINDVVLDFRDVDFMSRSFADQFYKEQQSYMQAKNVHIQIADADIQIIDVLQAVSKTQKRERSFTEYPVYTFVSENVLMDYLQAI